MYIYQQGKDVVGCKDETIELKQSMARPYGWKLAFTLLLKSDLYKKKEKSTEEAASGRESVDPSRIKHTFTTGHHLSINQSGQSFSGTCSKVLNIQETLLLLLASVDRNRLTDHGYC